MMIDAGAKAIVWNEETLGEHLPSLRDFAKDTKMGFASLADPAEVENLIACPRTFSPNHAGGE